MLVDGASILRWREERLGLSERRPAHRLDCGDGAQSAGAVAGQSPSLGVLAGSTPFRTRSANVFNPAALAAGRRPSCLPTTGQSWWGALPDLPPPALMVLSAATDCSSPIRVNKMPLVLSFLGGYYLLFTVTAFASGSRARRRVYRAPDLHAVLFLRVLHSHGSADVTGTSSRDQITSAAPSWPSLSYVGLRVDRRRVLPAGGRPGRQRLGVLAPSEPPNRPRFSGGDRRVPARTHAVARARQRLTGLQPKLGRSWVEAGLKLG